MSRVGKNGRILQGYRVTIKVSIGGIHPDLKKALKDVRNILVDFRGRDAYTWIFGGSALC